MNLIPSLQGSIEPSTPALIAQEWRKNGRGERIRTSGPCLPNAILLRLHGTFPSFMNANAPHMAVSVLRPFTPKVHNELSAPVFHLEDF